MPTFSVDTLAARDAVGQVPFSRWDLEVLRAGRSQSRIRFGGWIGDVSQFDATMFGIPVPEAELMDPQQRLLLEVWPGIQR